MKSVSQTDVIRFVKRKIIHHFGLLETLPCNNGLVFSGGEVSQFSQEYSMTITFSTPYYVQGNDQAEASNKVIKANLSKVINDNLRSWAEMLSKVLWAFRTSKRIAIGTTPYALTFGHDAILPMELTIKFLRVARQYKMIPNQYEDSIMAELYLKEERLLALNRVQAQKVKVAKAYDKKVRSKAFAESNLVLKAILPIGCKDPRFGKWSPTWEGPFVVHQVLKGRAYHLRTVDGQVQLRPLNGKYLKRGHAIDHQVQEFHVALSHDVLFEAGAWIGYDGLESVDHGFGLILGKDLLN
ncbi:uncharacterized protein LOC122659194 [Telopea speciosissima]|uniref:uncharacterized protein LOC122659194 n=1 Tax=Telopea speciosissima TaxID=54955 RepID=UPI001CC6AC8D|nr:uncharacterized protein LOC122659194 [Telopea speciosissima]